MTLLKTAAGNKELAVTSKVRHVQRDLDHAKQLFNEKIARAAAEYSDRVQRISATLAPAIEQIPTTDPQEAELQSHAG